ncbi:MAG: response regulator [Elusimicrobiales bacterium]|nr:response regulator [Elusimicrobiales bacterium]
MTGNTGTKNSGSLVLVAEDDGQSRRGLVRFLHAQGHDVIEAADGRAAIALARERKPDIILLDLAMPGRDGLEVLKELVPVLPDTGFIIVTGNEDEKIANSCLELGAFDYVPKPVDFDILSQTIKARLRFQRP